MTVTFNFYTITGEDGKEYRAAAPTRSLSKAAEYYGVPLKNIRHGAASRLPLYKFKAPDIVSLRGVITELSFEDDLGSTKLSLTFTAVDAQKEDLQYYLQRIHKLMQSNKLIRLMLLGEPDDK